MSCGMKRSDGDISDSSEICVDRKNNRLQGEGRFQQQSTELLGKRVIIGRGTLCEINSQSILIGEGGMESNVRRDFKLKGQDRLISASSRTWASVALNFDRSPPTFYFDNESTLQQRGCSYVLSFHFRFKGSLDIAK